MPNQVEAAGGALSGRGALSVLSASLPGQRGPSPRPLAGRGAGARPYMRAWHIVDTNRHFETQVSDQAAAWRSYQGDRRQEYQAGIERKTEAGYNDIC